MLANIDVDKLVWNDTHLLKRKSLDLCSWEALDDPTLTLLLMLINLFLDQLNNDFIIN